MTWLLIFEGLFLDFFVDDLNHIPEGRQVGVCSETSAGYRILGHKVSFHSGVSATLFSSISCCERKVRPDWYLFIKRNLFFLLDFKGRFIHNFKRSFPVWLRCWNLTTNFNGHTQCPPSVQICLSVSRSSSSRAARGIMVLLFQVLISPTCSRCVQCLLPHCFWCFVLSCCLPSTASTWFFCRVICIWFHFWMH